MKMTIEWFVMMFICLLFFDFGLCYMNMIMTHQSAMELEEYAIMMIEHYNRYDEYVANQIKAKTNQKLDVNVRAETGAYQVAVSYEAKSPFTHQTLRNTVYSMTKD